MNPRKSVSLIRLLAILLLLPMSSVAGQTERKLSAREIFYSPPPESTPARKAAPPKAGKTKETRPAETAEAKASPATPSSRTTSPVKTEGTQVVPVSYSSENAVPLGLRYSILKREGSGSSEVDPDTTFHSGDRIRLQVEVNTGGYLYIINRGSSGNWNPLFPSSKIANGDNHVEKGVQYEIPPGYVFTFDEQPGTEKLFVVFSRRPVADLEDLIYSLTGGQKLKTPARTDGGKVLLAMANIQDGTIDRLRNIYSRDLIIEKVDETKAAPPAAPANEKAVYVVNPSRAADARVVADITLIHK